MIQPVLSRELGPTRERIKTVTLLRSLIELSLEYVDA